MIQRTLPVLTVAVLLTGCQVSMPVAKLVPQAETEYATEIKSTIPAKVFPASAATPVKAPIQAARAGLGSPVTNASARAANQPGAAASVEEAAAGTASNGTPTLKFEAADGQTPRLVPMLNDERELKGVMTQPAAGALTWRVTSLHGPVAVAKWRATYRSVAKYPEAPAPTAETKGPPPLTPVGETGAPLATELEPQALQLSASFTLGKVQTLSWSLKNDFTREAIAANPRTAKLELTLVPLDASGAPLRGPDGQDLVITTPIAVL